MSHKRLFTFLSSGLAFVLFAATLYSATGGFNGSFSLARASKQHHGNHYIGLAPTCTEIGYSECWVSCDTHQVFTDPSSDEVTTGIWTETGVTANYGVGGADGSVVLPALGHEWNYTIIDDEHHSRQCERCGLIEDDLDHNFEENIVAPNGVRRGYTLHSCEECGDSYYDNFDFSLYEGVTFASNSNKYLIPYYFNSNTLTIEASLQLAPSHTGRGGVIVGSYGISDCLNIEINANGQVRVYATVNGIVYDMHFNADVRSNDIVNIAVTLVSQDSISLYIDGSLVETKSISYSLPEIGRKFTIGGDNRSNNAQYFKGTLYTLSIFKDVRTKNEIISDIILANANDPDCCVSYNLIDSTYLTNENDPAEDPYLYAEVSSLDELDYHCSIGTNSINVTSDIVLDRTIYAIGNVTLYSDNNSSIIRDPDFVGDMFVFGENEFGRNLILDDVDCNITFGKSDAEGTLIIDGNKNNMNDGVSVVGSIVYISYSANFTLNENASLINNKKVGNSRTYSNGHDGVNRIIGGAAVTVYSGAFTMNGGTINNCEVNDTDLSGGDDTSDNYRLSTYGGAIFNYGNFYMNGGIISNNRGFYGGALANYGVAFINSGTLSNNSSSYAGGSIYMVGQTHAQLYIGNNSSEDGIYDVVFSNNSTTSMGGAIYAGVWCNTMIYGSTKFEGNSASGRGGAIASNGFIEIKSNTLFKDNVSSNKGGAVSVYYDESSTLSRRECSFAGATFIGNSGTGGGAFYTVGADIQFSNCSFQNNSSTSNHGGAVYIDPTDGGVGADIQFSNCSFTNNTANTEAGAIFTDKFNDVTILNSTFNSNSCSTNGGAITCHGVNSLNIENSTFNGNNSASGGALYLSVRTVTVNDVSTTYDSTCTVSNSTFTNNTATVNGGAVYMYTILDGHKTGIFTGCEFSNNQAYLETEQNNTITKSGKGGAIYANNSDFDVIDSTFEDNVSGGAGGAIYSYNSAAVLSGISAMGNTAYGNGGFVCVDSSTGFNSSLTINNDSIIQNNSAVYGGAIALATATSSANINNTTFDSNESSNNGGAIYVNYGTLVCNNSEFDSNAAHSTSYGGGAIYGTNATITVSNTLFDDNSAKNGGAICCNTNSIVTLVNVNGSNNSSTAQGGFAYVNGGAQLTIYTLNNGTSTLSGNFAGNGGGAIYVTSTGSLSLTNVTLSNNSSNASGGALYLYCGSTTTISNCVFSSNAATNGAAIISYGASFTASGSTFTNNTTSDWGGAIYIRSGANSEVPTVIISGNSVFTNNNASNGGAIYINSYTIVNIQDTSFNSNTAELNGGAIYVSSCATLNVSDTSFISNTAAQKGGAICFYISESAADSQNKITSNLINTNFTGNSCTNGGAIYANNVVLTINGGTYFGNSSTGDGGVMYIKYSDINILNGAFTGNTCSGNGNFYINRSTFTTNSNGQGTVIFGTTVLSEKEIYGNTAQRGGVIYATVGSQVNLYYTTFGYNSATSSDAYGGAIHASGADSGSSTFVISHCTFVGNSCPNYGGAIGASNSSSVTISDSTFTNNTGKYGGAVAANNNAVIGITDSSFTSNSATTYGGAIWCTGATTVAIDGSSFTSNTAPNYGAIGCGGSSSLTITDSSFTSNSATSTATDNGNGGAIGATATSTLVIDGCHFTLNSASSTGNGGAVYSITTSANGASIINSEFNENSAKFGGAIVVNSGSTVELTSCAFDTDSATSNGGAIYVYGSSTLSAEDCEFTSCTASSGGAIAVNSGSTVELTSCAFDTDSATSNGGAIYVYGSSTLSAEDCEFTSCTASSGGAMRIGSSSTDNSVITLSGCSFASNSSTGNGGAIYLYTSNVNTHSFTGCTFTSNSATGNGGAFYISSASKATLTNTTMRNNVGTKGGAIYITNGSGCTTSMTIAGSYTSLNNNIYVGSTSTSVTIYSNGLVSEDNPSKTWSNIVSGKTSVVIYN